MTAGWNILSFWYQESLLCRWYVGGGRRVTYKAPGPGGPRPETWTAPSCITTTAGFTSLPHPRPFSWPKRFPCLLFQWIHLFFPNLGLAFLFHGWSGLKSRTLAHSEGYVSLRRQQVCMGLCLSIPARNHPAARSRLHSQPTLLGNLFLFLTRYFH